jgi:hypothetical protein
MQILKEKAAVSPIKRGCPDTGTASLKQVVLQITV